MVDPPNYLAFLLRLWRIDSQGKSIWRASLESPRTTVRTNFASTEALFAYLRECVLEPGDKNKPSDIRSDGMKDSASKDVS